MGVTDELGNPKGVFSQLPDAFEVMEFQSTSEGE
jgi:hypothetical protein